MNMNSDANSDLSPSVSLIVCEICEMRQRGLKIQIFIISGERMFRYTIYIHIFERACDCSMR